MESQRSLKCEFKSIAIADPQTGTRPHDFGRKRKGLERGRRKSNAESEKNRVPEGSRESSKSGIKSDLKEEGDGNPLPV